MKKKFIKTPLKGVEVHGAKDVGTRTVNLLMGEHAGEYVRGDIMDANAVVQAFDELKGNVDNNHDSLEEIVDELHNLRDATDQSFEIFQEKAEEETANRIQGDKTLDEKIDQKERESKERDNTLQQNIDTEKQERIDADTQLRNDLTAEVNRAKASENALSEDIKAEATKRENDDNTIKDNLNAEVTRATAKENEIKAEVDVINGDSTTEGSFRKAIADVVGAAPEAYDTLKEIADKLNENDDLHAAINDAIATKADKVALNEEITRAKAAEAENKAEIAAEAARAKGVEGDNALAIQNEESRATLAENATNDALNTEVERAKGQEAYLQNLVNTKADTTALDGTKTELDKKISDETTRATEEEDELRSLIVTEQNRATASEKSIADDLNGKLAKKADTTTLNEQVDTLNTAISAKQSIEDANNTKVELTEKINAKADATALTILEQKVTANTTAITNINKSGGIPYDTSITNYYQTNKPFYIKCDDDHTAYINPYSGIKVANSDTSYVNITPSIMKLSDGNASCEINEYIGGIQCLSGTGDDSNGLKLSYDGLRIGKKSAITQANNGELISISREYNTNIYTFKAKNNTIETNECKLNEYGLTNYKSSYIGNTDSDVLFLNHSALHGAILVENNSDLSIGADNNIRTNPYWKFGFNGAEYNGSDSAKRIDVKGVGYEYANIFGIKLTTDITKGGRVSLENPCEIQNNSDYVSFSKKIKVSDIITDATTDSSLNSILSNIGNAVASKQDKITPTTELDLTSIDTADIESLRSIVKALATELNTLGLIKLKSAE